MTELEICAKIEHPETPKSYFFMLPSDQQTPATIIAVIKKWPSLLNCFPDDKITAEAIDHIRTLDYSFAKCKHHLVYPDIPAETIVIKCLDPYSDKTFWHPYTSASMFDQLDCIKRSFIRWIKKFHTFPETCQYALDSIGYCAGDLHHKINPNWKEHVKQSSRQRLNVTNLFSDYFVKTSDWRSGDPLTFTDESD